MGKNDAVFGQLPKLPEYTYDEAVAKLREAYVGQGTAAVVNDYVRLRREAEALEVALREADKKVEAAQRTIVERFDAEQLHSLKLADGAMVYTELDIYPGATDKEALRLWCVEQGLERSMHLNPQTLKSLIKERLLNGERVECLRCRGKCVLEAIPEGATDNTCPDCNGTGGQPAPGVTVFQKTKLVLRGGKS